MSAHTQARQYIAALTDDELLVALSRQLSTRVRACGLEEATRRGIADLVDEPGGAA